MSILETMRNWLAECPYLDEFSGGHIDWTDNTAMEYGIMPTGSVTIRTEEDVLETKPSISSTIWHCMPGAGR